MAKSTLQYHQLHITKCYITNWEKVILRRHSGKKQVLDGGLTRLVMNGQNKRISSRMPKPHWSKQKQKKWESQLTNRVILVRCKKTSLKSNTSQPTDFWITKSLWTSLEKAASANPSVICLSVDWSRLKFEMALVANSPTSPSLCCFVLQVARVL
jgi:hypothetical protein